MNFAEQPPSEQWAALTFRGEKFAEVWFKPDGAPWALRFRIPQSSFHDRASAERLTVENLLKAVGIAPEEVESCRQGADSSPGLDSSSSDLGKALLQPPPDVPHLEIDVCLKPPTEALGPKEGSELEDAAKTWQDMEARWKAVLAMEGTMEVLRRNMDGVRAELMAMFNKQLTTEERMFALQADVLQYNKAKTRIHYTLPKAKEYIHRATWALGAPDRKKLEELFKNDTAGPMPVAQMEQVSQELDALRKERQVLSAHGVTVYQECKTLGADIQAALSRLQNNAATRANQQRAERRKKKKYT